MKMLTHIITHVWQKILEILQYPVGWLAGLGLFIADAFSDGLLILYIVVIATAVDLVCGIAVSFKRKRFAKSELMRQTVEKLVVYGAALLVFFSIDKVLEAETTLEVDLTSGVVGVVIALTETWSFLASLRILFPKNPLLRMISKALIGEIARKLNCEEADVEMILKESIRKKKQPRGKNGQFVAKTTKK